MRRFYLETDIKPSLNHKMYRHSVNVPTFNGKIIGLCKRNYYNDPEEEDTSNCDDRE